MLQKIILIGLLFFLSKLYSQDAGIGFEQPDLVKAKIDSLEKLLKNAINDTIAINTINQISKYYRTIDEYTSFIKAQEALDKSQKNNYAKGITEAYINLGFISNEQGLVEQAIDFYQKGAEMAQKNNFDNKHIYCLNGLAIIYWKQQDYNKSLDILKKILVYQEKLALREDIATTQNNIGVLYNEFKKYDTALMYLLKSQAYRVENKMEEKSIATLNNIGIAFLGKNQVDTALYYSLQSLKLAKKFFQKRRIKEATLTLSEIYAKMQKNDSAYKYLSEHKIILDSIEKQDKAAIIAQEKRKRDIQQQEEQIRILKQNSQLRNVIYFILTSFLLISIVALLLRARRKQRFYKILEQKNEEISNQKSIIEQQNAELLALNENLENLVEDRTKKLFEANVELQNVNKELDTYVYRFAHDFRGPLATMLGLVQIGKMETNNPSLIDILSKINLTATQMDTLLHKLSALYQISNHIVEYSHFDLKNICSEVLEKQAQKLALNKQDFFLNYTGVSKIYADKQLITICLEQIFENSLFFYKQKPIKLEVDVNLQGNKALMIIIKDSGQGIAKAHLSRAFEMFYRANEHSKGNGMGLHIVQKLVEKLQGAVHIESEKNSYTKIALIIPSYEEIRKQNQI